MKAKIVVLIPICFVFLTFVARAQNILPSQKLLYKVVHGDSLYLHVFEPPANTSPMPAIVFFFGEGWTVGSPLQFYQQSAYLASRGMVAVCAEYRVHNKYGASPFDCLEDGKTAIRWMRQHAQDLHIDPNKIVAGGGSAGGHIAICTAMMEGYENLDEDLSISAVPNAVVAFNPVLDTTEKGYGSEKLKGHETAISPCHHVKVIYLPCSSCTVGKTRQCPLKMQNALPT